MILESDKKMIQTRLMSSYLVQSPTLKDQQPSAYENQISDPLQQKNRALCQEKIQCFPDVELLLRCEKQLPGNMALYRKEMRTI